MADYLIPFGVDASPFLEGIRKMDQGTDSLAASVIETTKGMQKGFADAAGSADVLGKKLDVDTQKAVGLRDQAKAMGKEIGTALSGNNVGTGLEKNIDKFKKLMTDAAKGGVKIGFDINTQKLEDFERMLGESGNEIKTLAQVVDFARAKLAGLDPNSQEWEDLAHEISTAEQFLGVFGEAADQVGGKQKSLKAQLRAVKEELAQMEMAGEDTTAEFLQMSVRAGELEDQIGDISARVRVLASDTKYIDASIQAIGGLAGAFSAAQGAAALFGSENEAINRSIQKVTGAMAILQGIQAVANTLNKDSAFSVLFLSRAQGTAAVSTAALAAATGAEAVATEGATVATASWTAVLLANPIFLVVAAIAALVTAFVLFTSGSGDAEQATKDLNKAIEDLDKNMGYEEAALSRGADLRVAIAKKMGAAESEITGITKDELNKRLQLQREHTAALDAEVDKAIKGGAKSEDVNKAIQAARDSSQKELDLISEIQIKGIEAETQRTDEAKEGAKKRKELSDKALAEEKKRADERRAILDQEIKLRREFTAAYIESINDQYEKERQTLIKNTQEKIEDLQREKNLSAEAEKEKNDLIIILRQNLTAALKDVDKKREADRAALLFEGQQKLAELQKAGADQDLELSRLSYEQRKREINEQFKNEGELRLKLLGALATDQAAKEKKIKDDAAQAAIKEDEERAVLEVETAAKFMGDMPGLEEAKQLEILKVKLKYAEQNLKLLQDQGNAENSIVVLQAKKVIQDLNKGIADAQNSQESGFSFMKLLGLDGLTDDQQAAVLDAAKKSLDSITQITSFIVDQYARQIAAKQEVIDQETADIDRLESQLDKEKELRDKGLANNVEGIEAELAAKKAQRAQDLKDQEEMQKKQQAVQKAQLALDTATQASGLITSAANIFKSLSSIPFIGVPLAIATIGLMTGAFITAKVKAFQAIGDGNKKTFGQGGFIDGKKHTQGGKKYRAMDGTGDVVELEEGEHVTRATQAEKYADLLEAINNDELKGMSDDALRAMLAEMGIHMAADRPRESVTIVREREALQLAQGPGNDITKDVKGIRDDVGYLASQERERTQRWEDELYFYEKRGNKTRKTPKA
jgi:hypothetical protein